MSLSLSRRPRQGPSYLGFAVSRSRWGAHDHRRRSIGSVLLMWGLAAAGAIVLGFGLAEISRPPAPVDTSGIYFDPGPPALDPMLVEPVVAAAAPAAARPPAHLTSQAPPQASTRQAVAEAPRRAARPAQPPAKARAPEPKSLHAVGWPYARPAQDPPPP